MVMDANGGRFGPVQNEGSTPSREDGLPPRAIVDGGHQQFDRIFTALSSLRRRYVLYYLERKEPAAIVDVARHVAAWETDTPPPAVDEDSQAVQEVVISLYHEHFPKLADLHLVEYDRRSGDVRFRDCPELLLEVIALCRPRELPDPSFDTGSSTDG